MKKVKRVVLGEGHIYTGSFADGREVSLEDPGERWLGSMPLNFPKHLSGKLVRLIAEVIE